MTKGFLELLSQAWVVAVVGLAALGLLSVDLVARELAAQRSVTAQWRRYGALATVAFLALVTLRFIVVSH